MADYPRILLPSGREYNPSVAQDHTGQAFVSTGKQRPTRTVGDPNREPTNFMRNPKWLNCPQCGSAEFRILADDHPRADAMVQFYCPKAGCRTVWPVIQMQKPQMNNEIARRLGLPQAPFRAIEFDLEDLEDN